MKRYVLQYKKFRYDPWQVISSREYDTLEEAEAAFEALPVNRHFHEGRYWTYASRKGLAKMYPLWSESQIRRLTDKLRERGALLVGDFNDDRMQRTIWYSPGEAKALAEKRLRLHNKFARTAVFTLPGNPVLVAGVTVCLEGWGGWSGKYIVSQAVHSVGGGAYTTQIKLRRCLDGY